MFTLIKNAQKNVDEKLTTFFENKTWFLINEFFSTSFSTDLNDIFDVMYSLLMHCSTIITKKMIESMKKLNSNKTFKLNDIINRFLKFVKMIWSMYWYYFFLTCVNRKYYFKIYQKNNTIILRKSDKKQFWHCENMTSNCFIKHDEQDFWINNQQKTVIFDEALWLIIRCTNENLIEQIDEKIILKLFIKQIHKMWKIERNTIMTLLNINIAKIFSMINHVKLFNCVRTIVYYCSLND